MKLQEKQMIHGFAVDRSRYVPELHSQAYELHHVQSGARLLYIQNDDDNKVFSISFRTTPSDSTGVPHICEHSTLCGSRKFPLCRTGEGLAQYLPQRYDLSGQNHVSRSQPQRC